MATTANKRSSLALYHNLADHHSHVIRLVMAEKNVACECLDSSLEPIKQELQALVKQPILPTLVDRDLILSRIEGVGVLFILEYLDERFPHPPLFPVYPVSRAKARVAMQKIYNDWYRIMDRILSPQSDPIEKATMRERLLNSLLLAVPLFGEMSYFLSSEYSLIDCCMAPLLWRLKKMEIELPIEAKSIWEYAKKLFRRDAFQASLTDAERVL